MESWIHPIKDASLSTKSNGNNNYYNNYYNNDYDDDYNNYYNSYYKKKNNKTRKIQSIYNDNYYYLLDSASYLKIQSLSPYHLQNRGYGLVKRLKGIENGLGVILFIFPLLFLVINIIFLIFVCGIKEYKVLPDTTFNIFNTIKIICSTLSTIFIFLSVLYAVLLVVALVQYISLVGFIDSCAIGIIVGMVFGYYGIWYYIILSCAFCNERTLFLNVGCESKPGPDAKYDINGNALTHGNPQTSPITVVIPQSQPVLQIKEQKQNYSVNHSKSSGIGDEYITINGILYKRVDKSNDKNGEQIFNKNDAQKVNLKADDGSSQNVLINENREKRRNSITRKKSNKKRNSKSNIQVENIDKKEKDKTNQNNEWN